MTIYVQKVDEAAWRSDAPKSIGDAVYGLKSFRLDELAPMLPPMEPAQVLSLRKAVVAAGQSGLQVWGGLLPGVERADLRGFVLKREDAASVGVQAVLNGL